MPAPERGRVLVVGLGVAGEAAARQLERRGATVTVVEDAPSDSSRARAAGLDATIVEKPRPEELATLIGEADLVVPSPGVPGHHAVFDLARDAGVPVWSEFELAARWTSVPMVAVTGTNGKSTVITLVAEMLTRSGLRAIAAGNMEPPLVDVLDEELDWLVVEASSFRLQFTETFRPQVGVWLNLAEDHLDWHRTMEAYTAAKARIWAVQRPGDVAVANAEDPVVMHAAGSVDARLITFGLDEGDYRVDRGSLVGPEVLEILPVDALRRDLPHDRANALAAAAAALAVGADLEAVRATLTSFRGLPHRIALVGEALGVRYYDDSKATDPPAALAAIRSFDSIVLIAGGRNKGLDLSVLASESNRVRSVVAIGEAAAEVEQVFAPFCPVTRAESMDAAVAFARDRARPGDVVLLSPACASYDWYRSYGERGDDFARAVQTQLEPA